MDELEAAWKAATADERTEFLGWILDAGSDETMMRISHWLQIRAAIMEDE
jgi:hypothetical protein